MTTGSRQFDPEALVHAAMRAPSSHNTQPWRFELSGKRMRLFADRRRALPVNDPDDRELTISCGCALMNLRVAIAAAGFGHEVLPADEAQADDLLAEVTVGDSREPEDEFAALAPAIASRRTVRDAFREGAIPDKTAGAIREAAWNEGVSLHLVRDPELRAGIAELVEKGDAAQWADAGWRRELAAWMRPRRQGEGLGVPAALAPLVRLAIRHLNMGRSVAAKDGRLTREAPLLASIGTPGDTRADWLAAGQALERVLLTASLHGLQAGFLNQPIQLASLRADLLRMIPGSALPQLLIRLGYPPEAGHVSTRRDPSAVLTVAASQDR